MLTRKPKSKFEIAFHEFDYSEGLNTLRTFGMESAQSEAVNNERTTHMQFLSLMGSIVRQGSESEQLALKKAICGKRSVEAFSEYSDHKAWINVPHHNGNQAVNSSPCPTESDAPEIALYSMTLKEQGDILRVTPSYTEETISLYPPNFKVTVKFQHITSVGMGRTKKLAKHEASKRACKSLNFNAL